MNRSIILKELKITAVKSSGAGGQHVNKVSTKINIYFDITSSKGLSNIEKDLLVIKLQNKISKQGVLALSCETTRSQLRNKEIAVNKLFQVLENNLKVNKTRKTTKPTRSSILKNSQLKKRHSEKKMLRKKPKL